MSEQEREQDSKQAGSSDEGQVSEVSGLQRAGEPITPGDSVAAHPDDDTVDEGMTGPEAPTGNQDEEGEPR